MAPWGRGRRAWLAGTLARPFSLPRRGASRPDETPERRLILRALQEFAGFDRGVFYDVPPADAPEPLPHSPIYLRGSAPWHRFLRDRRRFDDGLPALLLALRPLSDMERLLAVDWGTTFANTFMLVEPSDPACDLTQRGNPVYRSLETAAIALLAERTPESDPDIPWTRETALGSILRLVFGTWVYWTGTYSAKRTHCLPLTANRPENTLASLIVPQLPARFPQAAFNRALADLHERETELFHGTVATARMPFRTRLGLPLLHDPACADRALRRLVNDGRATVYHLTGGGIHRYGPGRPVPESMTDNEFARLVL